MYGYVYKTTDLLKNKIYIGQHKGHIFDNTYYGSGSWFRAVLQKYGKDNFKCEMLESCETLDALNEREIYWIEKYQSRNPQIGYNLAEGGGSTVVGCTDAEIRYISASLWNADQYNIMDIVADLQKYGLKIYEAGDDWIPTSNNSNGAKMSAIGNSIVLSFYTKRQKSLTKEYANWLKCSFWKYNMMVEIEKIPQLCARLKKDYEEKKIIPEDKGTGQGTTGVFFETHKLSKSARMSIIFSCD